MQKQRSDARLQAFLLTNELLPSKPKRKPRTPKEPTAVLEWMDEDSDPEINQENWDDTMQQLTHLLIDISIRNSYHHFWNVQASGMGWRSTSGEAQVRASTGAELLQKILPHTDCHFRIFRQHNTLRLQNYHHDSPVGNEWYTITAMNSKAVDQGYKEGLF